jgi:photosystem II stability/assembly factor-like uncharacterized protein
MSGSAHARTSRQAVPTSIAFWDRNHGLAGFVVYGPTGRLEGYVSATSDGGRTWSTSWRGPAVTDIAVVRGTPDALARIWPRPTCVDCPPLLLRTKDRGRTWEQAGTARTMPSFPTRRRGFAMRSGRANAGDLMRTTDGGRTWRRVPSPCRKGWGGFATDASLSFASPNRGWLLCLGRPRGDGQSMALYRTSSGGRTWKRLVNDHFEPGPIRRGGFAGRYPRGISFTGSGRGLLWARRGVSYGTTDGGRHWLPIPGTSATREGLSGWVVSDRVGYLLLQNDDLRRDWELLRTDDGGKRWRRVHSWPRR